MNIRNIYKPPPSSYEHGNATPRHPKENKALLRDQGEWGDIGVGVPLDSHNMSPYCWCLVFCKAMLKQKHLSGQIIIFHQPRFS